MNDGNEIILALSDNEKYVGVPTRASGLGLWCYLDPLKEAENQVTFHTLIK